MSIDFNFDEVLKLSADLGNVGRDVMPDIRKAVEVTARHIKDDSRKTAKRTGLAGYAASIDYDMEYENGSIGASIGPNLGKPMGSFGFVEDAPGGVRSAPQQALKKASKGNEADFEKGLREAIGDIL